MVKRFMVTPGWFLACPSSDAATLAWGSRFLRRVPDSRLSAYASIHGCSLSDRSIRQCHGMNRLVWAVHGCGEANNVSCRPVLLGIERFLLSNPWIQAIPGQT
jgi:hypothetical protein